MVELYLNAYRLAQNGENDIHRKNDLATRINFLTEYIRLSMPGIIPDEPDDGGLPDFWHPYIPDPRRRRDDDRPHFPPGQPIIPPWQIPWIPPGPATPNPDLSGGPPAAIAKDLYAIIQN